MSQYPYKLSLNSEKFMHIFPKIAIHYKMFFICFILMNFSYFCRYFVFLLFNYISYELHGKKWMFNNWTCSNVITRCSTVISKILIFAYFNISDITDKYVPK